MRVEIERQEGKEAEGHVRYLPLRRLHIDRELSTADRGRLLDNANMCPIHRVLVSEITVGGMVPDNGRP